MEQDVEIACEVKKEPFSFFEENHFEIKKESEYFPDKLESVALVMSGEDTQRQNKKMLKCRSVDRILDKRNGGLEYLVKWKNGEDPNDLAWELASNLTMMKAKIKKFEKNYKYRNPNVNMKIGSVCTITNNNFKVQHTDLEETDSSNFVNDDKKKHKCKEINCTASFRQKYQLDDHLRFVHGDTKLGCQHKDCGKAFTHKFALHRHMLKEHKNMLKCQEPGCSAEFTFKPAYLSHLKKTHQITSKSLFKCDKCGHTTFRKSKHIEHTQRAHTFENGRVWFGMEGNSQGEALDDGT